jgi:hypothetical protein
MALRRAGSNIRGGIEDTANIKSPVPAGKGFPFDRTRDGAVLRAM